MIVTIFKKKVATTLSPTNTSQIPDLVINNACQNLTEAIIKLVQDHTSYTSSDFFLVYLYYGTRN